MAYDYEEGAKRVGEKAKKARNMDFLYEQYLKNHGARDFPGREGQGGPPLSREEFEKQQGDVQSMWYLRDTAPEREKEEAKSEALDKEKRLTDLILEQAKIKAGGSAQAAQVKQVATEKEARMKLRNTEGYQRTAATAAQAFEANGLPYDHSKDIDENMVGLNTLHPEVRKKIHDQISVGLARPEKESKPEVNQTKAMKGLTDIAKRRSAIMKPPKTSAFSQALGVTGQGPTLSPEQEKELKVLDAQAKNYLQFIDPELLTPELKTALGLGEKGGGIESMAVHEKGGQAKTADTVKSKSGRMMKRDPNSPTGYVYAD